MASRSPAGTARWFFHLVNRPIGLAGKENRIARAIGSAALTLRLSLLVREFSRLSGRTLDATAGAVIPWRTIEPLRDRKALLGFVRDAVMRLGVTGA